MTLTLEPKELKNDYKAPNYKNLLSEAVEVIESLVDDTYESPAEIERFLQKFIDAVNTPPSVCDLPVGPGWRVFDSYSIQVDEKTYRSKWNRKKEMYVFVVGDEIVPNRKEDGQLKSFEEIVADIRVSFKRQSENSL